MQGQPFVNLVRDAVDFASLSSGSSTLSGNEKSVPKKCHVADWTKDDVNVSHRPDIVYVNVPRQSTTHYEVPHRERIIKRHLQLASAIAEREIHKTMWAIRRIPSGSKITCMGMLDGRKKCGILLTTGKTTETIVAPSFFCRRQYNSGETM